MVVALLGLLGLLVPGVAHAAPPPNDDFDQATAITTLPFTTTQTADEATQASDDPSSCNSSRSVWFTYTATTSGSITATTAGSGYDTVLSAFTGTRGALTPLGCNDDASGGHHSRLDLAVVAGTQYHFMAAAFSSGSAGPLTFSVTAFAPPGHDAFANAEPVTALPHTSSPDLATATVEPGEPNSGCGSVTRSLWYAVTLPETTPVTLTSSTYNTRFAVYTGSALANLTEVGCSPYDNIMTFRANPGTTYYIRLGNAYDTAPTLTFTIGVAQPVVAAFYHYSHNSSVFSDVSFHDQSSVPGAPASVTKAWDFGDGATAEGDYPQHRYAADGDYPVTLTVTTSDGRTGSVTNVVRIRTHDIAITRFTTPGTAVVGATKTLTARIGNTRYAEDVTVRLYRGTPSGWEEIGHSTQWVPASATGAVNFPFNYTFRPGDAALGKINFRVVATLVGATDALPLDNEVISTTTTVQSATTGRDAA
ncbi:PKD domain-containing protein [Saccharothrix stipae]